MAYVSRKRLCDVRGCGREFTGQFEPYGLAFCHVHADVADACWEQLKASMTGSTP